MSTSFTAYGQGAAQAARALEREIAKVAAWQGRTLSYRVVSGGISNANWRVRVEGDAQDYFVKIPGPGTEIFVDRRAAHDASLAAAASGYGPPVVGFIEDSGVEILGYVDGWRSSSNDDFLQPHMRRNATTALRAFNDQPRLGLTKTVFDMIDEHEAQSAELGARRPLDHAWLRLQCDRAKAAITAAGIDLVPCMNDTIAANFMVDGTGEVMLIDFEYASNNDRAYEIAMWFGEMFFDPDTEAEIIEDYFGQVTPEISARIHLHKALADIKWATWSMVQRRISSIDFDYYKYGIWKFMRARTLMNSDSWEYSLRKV
ncbi:MAG: choline kinase family protein [Zavarzinia sp.]|nr:choline kinase family protein [Zavarzinia sp.]